MRSTERLWPPEARARKRLKLVWNTILATMRHGCSIQTATISRSFIKARASPVQTDAGSSRWRRRRPHSSLQDNLASFDLALSAEQVKALAEASQIDHGSPYTFYAKEHVRATAYGGMRDQIMARLTVLRIQIVTTSEASVIGR